MKESVDENKIRVDQEFRRKLSDRFMGSRKLRWKEVKKKEM